MSIARVNLSKYSKTDLSYIVLSLFVFVYVLIRSVNVDVTYDESWTLRDFVPLPFHHILNFTPPDTNNHILNSLLIKFLFTFLPDSTFVSRIPNLIALGFFLVYGVKLCRRFMPGITGILTFCVLALNPFSLDFFGLARGYGIVLGMQVSALYFILSYLEERQMRSLGLSFMFAGIMVLANLSSLYFYLAWLSIFFIYSVLYSKDLLHKKHLPVLLITGLLILIIWEPLRKLIKTGGIYFGGNEGFYHDTVLSLTRYSMYSHDSSPFISYVCGTFFILLLVCFLASFLSKPKPRTKQLVVFGLLSVTILSLFLQHYVFDGLWVTGRAALFFYPLVILLLFFSIELLPGKRISRIASCIFSAAFIVNFLSNANLYKTINWYFDSRTLEVLNAVEKHGDSLGKIQKIDFSWPLESGINHYLRKGLFKHVANVKRGYSELNENFDFYFHLGGTPDGVYYWPEIQAIHSKPKDTVLAFPSEKLYLFKRKAGH